MVLASCNQRLSFIIQSRVVLERNSKEDIIMGSVKLGHSIQDCTLCIIGNHLTFYCDQCQRDKNTMACPSNMQRI